MGWDASLWDDRGHCDGEWNYTHNCNPMVNVALIRLGLDVRADVPAFWGDSVCWWGHLDGMDGPQGAAFLDALLGELRTDRAMYEAMNPVSGWGNWVSFVAVLSEMRDAVPEWPTVWKVGG